MGYLKAEKNKIGEEFFVWWSKAEINERTQKYHKHNYSELNSCRGVCGAVWFGFEGKSHLNCKIKKHAVWFGWLTLKITSKPNQCGLGWISWYGFFRDDKFFVSNIKIRL